MANLPTGAQLRLVSFIDERIGWAAGDTRDGKSFLMQTVDAGRTWVTLPAPAVYLRAGGELRFADSQHGWLRGSVLLAGNIGGCSPPSTAPPQCRSVMLRTDDGGHSWAEQVSEDQPPKLGPGIRALTVLDDHHAWAVRFGDASPGTRACTPFDCAISVVATTDGSTWTRLGDLPAFADGLDFVDPQTGFASVHTAKNEAGTPVNTALIVVTHDGGRTWSTQLRADGPAPRFLVQFLDARNGFALQQDLIAPRSGQDSWLYSFYRTGDAGQTWDEVQRAPSNATGGWWSPRGNLAALGVPTFTSADVGWIPILRDTPQSLSGGVLATTDGGRSWKRSPASPEGWETRDLAARGSTAWVIGQRASDHASFMARTQDAGLTWDYPLLAHP